MAEQKESIWESLFKFIFGCILLVSVLSGNYLAGTSTLDEKLLSGAFVIGSADKVLRSDGK